MEEWVGFFDLQCVSSVRAGRQSQHWIFLSLFLSYVLQLSSDAVVR